MNTIDFNDAKAATNNGLVGRPRCPACNTAGKIIVRTTVRDIGQWPKFRGDHYRLEKLQLTADTPFFVRWCAECEFGFADPLLDGEHLGRLYNDVIDKQQARTAYANSMDLRQRHVKQILSILDRQVSPNAPKTLLDFGAGWGLLLREARSRGWESYGIELADEERDTLRREGFTMFGGLDDVPDEFFDAVGSTQVLEHVPNFQDVINAQSNKLKPGGLLYVDVPNAGYFARRNPSLFGNPLEHVNYFTRRSLTRRIVAPALFRLVWPQRFTAPKESWRALRQSIGLAPLTLVFQKRP